MKSEEIMSESSKSFEDAIQQAVTRFSATVRGVRSAYVNHQSVQVEDGKITSYRVNLNITFEIEEPKKAPAATAAKKKS
jgi:flavin-binding protein dodecin